MERSIRRRPAGVAPLLALTVVGLLLALAAPAGAVPKRFFGENYSSDVERNGERLSYVARTGAAYLRVDLDTLTPTSPDASDDATRYDWTKDDNLFRAASRRGITILPLLHAPAPSDPADWPRFVRAVVSRYESKGVFWGGRTARYAPPAWEVMNEPNMVNADGTPDPPRYEGLLHTAAQAIHSAGGKVMFAGLFWYAKHADGDTPGIEFLRQALKDGAGDDVDGFALHPYAFTDLAHQGNVRGPVNRILAAVRELRGVLDDHASSRGKPIWINELGWPAKTDYGDPPPAPTDTANDDAVKLRTQVEVPARTQAQLLKASFKAIARIADRDNIRSLIWYFTRDVGGFAWDRYTGLQKRDGCYRPAYRALMAQTGEPRVAPRLSSGPFGIVDGAPGVVSVRARLGSGLASPCARVEVQFQKWDGRAWRGQGSVAATDTDPSPDVNDTFVVSNHVVGVGRWRARAVYAGEGPLRSATAPFDVFTIARGDGHPAPVNRPGGGGGGGGGGRPGAPPAPGLTATQAFVTVDRALNGQPGWVTVHGHVLGGSAPLNGVYVNVNFQKQQPNGDWETMSSAHPVLVNGAYTVDDWRVGVGQWRVRTVLPQQGTFAESVSDYRGFAIGFGYRLVNRGSRLCLTISQNSPANGSPIIQWPCFAGGPGDGQVVTLIPMGGGWSEIAFNSTGKCLDVTGASVADNVHLQEWDCLGAAQPNQLWQLIPIAGQPPWIALGAQHSGKCADALGMSVNQGTRIGQWTCTWTGNQQWVLQAAG
jgi:Ricin-type beta-trefoil lectin domain